MLNKKALSATAQVEKDSDFKSTVLLLHGDGTNGAQNNTFTDSSTNAFSITRNGNATQGTFSPFSVGASEWSNYFDGTGDSLSIPSSSNLSLGSGDFTIEFWIYTSSNGNIINPTTSTGSGFWGLLMQDGGLNWNNSYNVSNLFSVTATSIQNNAWHHVAVVRSSGVFKVFFDGVSQSAASGTFTDSTNYSGVDGWKIGSGNLADFNGYISNFRIIKGTAQYTANFTVSTTPLTAITNTQLLTCQSNRFIDNSSNAFTITRNGDVSVQAFSPFAPTAAYSAGTNGGSGYFDGSGDDYLSVANNTALQLGSGDFTVEFWLNFSALSGYQTVFEKGYTNSGGILIQTNNNVGTLLVYASGSAVITASSSSSVGVWDHYALVRSGSTLTLYRNGLSVGSATNSTNFSTTDTLYIGGSTGGGGYYTNGYISNFRIVKGTAVYTAAFTPPTAPLTAITNTSLLCNFTNAGIIDQTAKNVLETVGNAQIDTGTKKFGTGSIYFDGTGDNLKIPHSVNQQFGTGDFTFEAWIYPTAITGTTVRDIVCKGQNGSGSFEIAVRDSKIRMYTDIVVFTSSSNVTANAWQHIALTRSGTTLRFFLDGALDTTTTSFSTNFNDTGDLFFGSYGNGTQNYFTGYIDDIRITKGVARYTAAFTAPTKAFADQ